MKPHAPHLSSPIGEKITWANSCYRRFRGDLLANGDVVQLLERLQEALRVSHAAMERAGVNHLCRACEKLEGGSCCGAGLENRYDGWLLLINLLLGVELPTASQDDRSCLFLGENGCTLPARHVICINYICPKITDTIPKQTLQNLREKEGDEINALFLLNEKVKSILYPLLD